MREPLGPLVVPLAYLLDQVLGDPHFRLHPVRLIGDLAEAARRVTYPWGAPGGLVTLLFTAAVFVLAVWASVRLFPPLEALWLYFFVAERALRREAEAVGRLLARGELVRARRKLSFIVGRETRRLSPSECVRAAVETVAENFTDALVGPLFWYLVGGICAAAAYKCAEVLDSMYGYRTPRWRRFGAFPARADDLLNLIPARLAALFLALAAALCGLSGRRALVTAWREAGRHESPNSGWTEAAVAGALGIELGGPVVYQGKVFDRARFGRPLREREVEDVFRAARLLRVAAFLFVVFISALEVFLWTFGCPHLIALITRGLSAAWTA